MKQAYQCLHTWHSAWHMAGVQSICNYFLIGATPSIPINPILFKLESLKKEN